MYITIKKTQEQLTENDLARSLNELLFGEKEKTPIKEVENATHITICRDKEALRNFFNKHKHWYTANIPEPPNWDLNEIHNHYYSFKIPKRSGGLRNIDAPDDDLKLYLSRLKNYLENDLKILTHDSAHAYVKRRSTVTDIKCHQANNSNWFLKLDLKDFFPSHTLEYTLQKMETIYPLGFLMEDPEYKEKLKNALQYAFLDGKLPQGTPLSPTLTNILMTPIDYVIQHELWNMKKRFVYTRYADDMTISSPYKFNWQEVEQRVQNILTTNNTPFKVKTEKTHFGSKSGKNWNLGIMLNKDNRITIGHKQNQRFRAAVFNLMQDYKNGITWSIEDRQTLAGQIAYYKSIDPEYTQAVITRYETKFNIRLKVILKA